MNTATPNTVNRRQILIGVCALLIGTLVYIVDRPPDQTYFVYSSNITISLYDTLPNLFGLVGNSLPAFIHVFSFILITAGVRHCTKRGYVIICLVWFLFDCAFELGQKFSAWAVRIIPDWVTDIPFLENSENYFLQGTFDIADLAAISIGTVASNFVLLTTMVRK